MLRLMPAAAASPKTVANAVRRYEIRATPNHAGLGLARTDAQTLGAATDVTAPKRAPRAANKIDTACSAYRPTPRALAHFQDAGLWAGLPPGSADLGVHESGEALLDAKSVRSPRRVRRGTPTIAFVVSHS